MIRTCLLLAVLPVLACAASTDVPPQNPRSATQSSLLGTATVYRGDCTEAQLSFDDLEVYRSMAARAMAMGRAAVNSDAFRQCLEHVMLNDNVNMPQEAIGNQNGWGPYCPPGNFAGSGDCGTMLTRDAHWDRLSADGMQLDAIRRFYARRARIEAQSANDVSINCYPDVRPDGTFTNGSAFSASPWTDDRSVSETIYVPLSGILAAVAIERGSNNAAKERDYRGQASIYWHEVMHFHGYDHDRQTVERSKDQIPHIVGACVLDTLGRGQELQAAGACNSVMQPCEKGGRLVPASFQRPGQSGTCACAADPAFTAAPQRTNRWEGLTLGPSITVDSFGEGVLRMDQGGSTYRLVNGTWQWVASNSTEIYAGGSVLVRRDSSGNVIRQLPGGSWGILGTSGPNSITMDDIGTIYRRSASQIDMYRVGGNGWQVIGGTSGVILAGGDRFFATDPSTGHIYRYNHGTNSWQYRGGPAAWFTADAFGTLYGLATNKLSIQRNRWGAGWEGYGGDADTIGASVRFYARGLNNQGLWRRFPNGSWASVGHCPYYAVGGTSVYCVYHTGSSWTIDEYARD